MDPEIIDYPPDGTVDDLSTTCSGDEDGFRAKLTGLRRVQDGAGNLAIRATYQPVPLNQPYTTKELFFFDITNASASQRHNLTVQQLAQGRALAFAGADNVEVYLGGEEAVVAVYREP